MSHFKSNTNSGNPNGTANVSKGELGGPRFQNKNLNTFRTNQLGGRTGQSKSGVQVIQAKQKLGKAVGAAALPPTPLNTPSLKKETETSQSAPWNGPGGQNPEDGSPSLKGLSGPAKPAPWAKPGSLTEVEKHEEPKADLSATAKQQARSWANADDSDDEDRQDNLPETEWPDNFRETVDDLPPPVHSVNLIEQQRYVPPSVRSKPTNFNRNDPENFYDNRYSSQDNSTNSMNNRGQHRDRDDRSNYRRDQGGDGRYQQRIGGGFNRYEDGHEVRSFEQRGRFKNRTDDDETRGDNRVSSRFQVEQQDYPPRGPERNDRSGGDHDSRFDRGPYYRSSGANYDNRGGYGSHPQQHISDSRYGNSGGRYQNRDRGGDGGYYQKRGSGGYYHSGGGSDEGDSQSRYRSRTMSEDYQQKPNIPYGRDSVPADDNVDLKGIETSRLEAEYLESRKSSMPERRIDGPDRRSNYQEPYRSHEVHDQRHGPRSTHMYDIQSHDQRPPMSAPPSRANEENSWSRPSGPFSSGLSHRSRFESERERIPDYNTVRKDNTNATGNVPGAYKGPDAVKLSFPQPSVEEQLQSSNDNISPHSYYERPDYDLNNRRSAPRMARDQREPPFNNLPQTTIIHSGASRHDEDGPMKPRTKQLFDPKSDQFLDASGATKPKIKSRSNTGEGLVDPEKWAKVTPPEKTIEDENNRIDEISEKARIAEERKVARQKERMTREPRTKGFLYRFNEHGELERVLSAWEKEQEALAQKKSLEEGDENHTDDHRVTVLRKNDNTENTRRPATTGPARGTTHVEVTNNQQVQAKLEGQSSSLRESNLDNAKSSLDSGILDTFMQNSLFDSWNRSGPSTIDENRSNNDLPAQNRMDWLTGNSSAANPPFTSGLSSLSTGFAGIMSNSNVPNTLFTDNQRDWTIDTILQSEDPVFTNNLNEMDRPASFSPFSGINLGNLQDGGSLMSTDKKDNSSFMGHAEEATNVAPIGNSKFFQREWQRFTNSNNFGAVGNKSATTNKSNTMKTNSTVGSTEPSVEEMETIHTTSVTSASAPSSAPEPMGDDQENPNKDGDKSNDPDTSHRKGGLTITRGPPRGDSRKPREDFRGQSSHDRSRPNRSSTVYSSSRPSTAPYRAGPRIPASRSSDLNDDNNNTGRESEANQRPGEDKPSSDLQNSSRRIDRTGASTHSSGNSRRTYGSSSNTSNSQSQNYSSSRSSNNYSNSNSSNRNPRPSSSRGGRGFSGPRAHSEVVSQTKAEQNSKQEPPPAV